jgi:hypothetical protein
MLSHKILKNIIGNLENNRFSDAQDDCLLLPDCREKTKLYNTIGAIDSQPTEQAFEGTKAAAIGLAHRLVGVI